MGLENKKRKTLIYRDQLKFLQINICLPSCKSDVILEDVGYGDYFWRFLTKKTSIALKSRRANKIVFNSYLKIP